MPWCLIKESGHVPHLRSLAHCFVWITLFWPFVAPSLNTFRCHRPWREVAGGLSQDGPSGSTEGAVVEGRADQHALLFEETQGGASEKLPGVGVGRAEFGLEFGQSEVRRAIVLEVYG